jgi:hypothetical protein
MSCGFARLRSNASFIISRMPRGNCSETAAWPPHVTSGHACLFQAGRLRLR